MKVDLDLEYREPEKKVGLDLEDMHISTRHAMPYKFNPNASPRAPASVAISASGVWKSENSKGLELP